MNRIERRTTGTRPGAPVCNPGVPARKTGMLGGAYLYQRQSRQTSSSAPATHRRVLQRAASVCAGEGVSARAGADAGAGTDTGAGVRARTRAWAILT